jgi:hypothetical protein
MAKKKYNKYTPKQMRLFLAVLSGMSIEDASLEVGFSKSWGYKWLSKHRNDKEFFETMEAAGLTDSFLVLKIMERLGATRPVWNPLTSKLEYHPDNGAQNEALKIALQTKGKLITRHEGEMNVRNFQMTRDEAEKFVMDEA